MNKKVLIETLITSVILAPQQASTNTSLQFLEGGSEWDPLTKLCLFIAILHINIGMLKLIQVSQKSQLQKGMYLTPLDYFPSDLIHLFPDWDTLVYTLSFSY